MTDHANELRRHARKIPHPQGETPGVMLRAADEIERLQRVIASPYSMTRDDVIRMAREAGLLIPSFRIDGGLALGACTVPDFERFASLVAAAEREARAQLVEKNADVCGPNTIHKFDKGSALRPSAEFSRSKIEMIVEWSRTTRGGKQFDLLAVESASLDACASAYGLCE